MSRPIRLTGDGPHNEARFRRAADAVPVLIEFYRLLRQTYPMASTIYVVVDNWPVSYHPDVLAALDPNKHLLSCLRLPVGVRSSPNLNTVR